jgi:eukaryotic-like serine/threonine-protein kinase
MQATLSHYRILEQIGAGGMGVVYRAHDERLDRDVALKVLPPRTELESGARKRFHKEALLLSQLNHPNIATVHDFDTQDGTDFLVEEFIDGLSLDAMLASGPLPEREIIHLGLQLVEGLAVAHEHGVIHRDLKPGNVRVTSDARLKILDFGLAVILCGEPSPTAVTESLSETRAVVGTLPYMAPEQLLGGKLGARTDIWAVGCILFEMAAGRRPFLGSGPALSDAILHEPPPAVSKVNPRISAALDAVIQKCLDKDPQKRYLSAREIAVDFERALSPSLPAPIRPRGKRWFAALAVAAALSAVVGTVRVLPILHHNSSPNPSAQLVSQGQTAPHESYLAGLKYLERWDKPDNLDSAIALFDRAVRADPGFALGFSALGEAHWAKYRLDHDARWIDEAERDCKRAAELNQQLPAIYVTLALVHNGRGQYNLALQEIEQALTLEPLNPDALLGEAAVFAGMGREDQAETTYKKAAALRPQHWDGYYELGAFYYRQRRFADAAAQFEQALEITPDNALVHATLGGMMQLLGKNAEAEEHLKRSLELHRSYAAYTNLGALYYREKRWEESVAMTQKALDINPNDWRAWLNLGLANEWLNRNAEAEQAFRNEQARLETIFKVRGDDAEVQVELGLLYSKRRQREKAVPFVEAALARAPEDPSVLVTASEAYENLGNRSRALELVQQALAHGSSLEDLVNDPGQQNLIRDSRFREIARQFKTNSSPAQPQP